MAAPKTALPASGTPSRREEIIAAARTLFEEKGLGKTRINDITDAVGVTRSLFYHYFPDKDAVVEAVLDDYVADFVQMTSFWNEGRTRGDLQGALRSCIAMIRRGVFDKDPFRQDLVGTENASLYLRFYARATEALARYVTDTTAAEYAQFHDVKIDHVYETFYVLIAGIVAFMRRYPDASDELLEDLVAQTLRIDMSETYTLQKQGG